MVLPTLSVTVPCYNEAENIPHLLKEFSKFSNINFELILVNNGSTDNTEQILNKELKKYKFARSLKVKKNIGYGHGILTGLMGSKGSVLAYTHADLQCNPKDVFRAFSVFNQTKENIIVKGRRVGRAFGPFLWARGLDVFATLIIGQIFYDINAQPKMFRKEHLKILEKAPNGFSLDLYLIAKAKKEKIKIKTITVRFNKRLYGKSKWAINFKAKIKNIVNFMKACYQTKLDI